MWFSGGLPGALTPGEGGVVRLQCEEAAGAEVAVLVVVDHCSALQQELMDVGLQGQHVPAEECVST